MRACLTIVLFSISFQCFSQTWKELNDSLVLYYNGGLYNKGVEIGDKTIQAAKKEFGEAHVNYTYSLNNLASLYAKMGLYQKAELLYLESLGIRKKILGDNNPAYASALNNLGAFYMSMGEYIKAETFYTQSATIIKKVYGSTHIHYSTSLINLASLFDIKGEFVKAEQFYLESIAIDKKVLGEEHADYGTGLKSLAGFYYKLGQYEKAKSLFMQCVSIHQKALGKKHIEYASSLSGLASIYKRIGEYKKADTLFQIVLAIEKEALTEWHPSYAKSLQQLAGLYTSTKEYKKAESLLLQAVEIGKNKLGKTHPDYGKFLHSLASLYMRMELYEKAEPYFLEAREIFKIKFGNSNPDYESSLSELSLLYQYTAQFIKAEAYLLENTALVRHNILKTFPALSENEKQNLLDNKIVVSEITNSYVFNSKKTSSAVLQDGYISQIFFKGLILDKSRNMIGVIQQSKDSSIQKTFNKWKSNKTILAKEFSIPISKRRKDLAEVEKETETLEKELTRKSDQFRYQQQSFLTTINNVEKKLQADEVAVEFISFQLYNRKWTDTIIYAAYILRKGDAVPQFIPLCEEKQLQKLFDSAGTSTTAMVSKFYRGLEVKNKNAAGTLGKELYKLIWQPLEPYLKGVKKISYSPAGKLYSIAFHALPVDSTRVLMDKYQLQQYTSTRQVALREQEKQNSKPQYITLFGDASFTLDSLQLVKQKIYNPDKNTISTSIYTPKKRNDENNTWISLPGTAQEVKTIQQLFEQNKITTKSFTQITASEENLKALSGNSPQILHIATHGFFLPEPDKKRKENNFNNENSYTLADDPLLRSGLILAGGNYAWSGKTPIDGVEDGIATAYEISQLDLSNTELVVLSACETALGDVKGSEGVFGLQRAFKMAGVKKMIVSLWQVPDKETAELMTSFYSYWMKGKTINDAFTQAQADMRKKYSPFYWAAFVLVE